MRYARAQNAHLRLSKLRFFALRKPKNPSCYTISNKETPRQNRRGVFL